MTNECLPRLYHRTPAGRKACRSLYPGLPRAHMRVLRSIGHATELGYIARRLSEYPEPRLLEILSALERAGVVESVSLQWLEDLAELGYYEPTPLAG